MTVDSGGRQGAVSERDALVREAYEGEIVGEAIFATLGGRAADAHQREACRLIEEIEAITGQVMSSVVNRYGVRCDGEAARLEGEQFAAAFDGEDWRSFWEKLLPLAEDALNGMRRLRALGAEDDRRALDQLVAHEVAITEFIRRELAGSEDALQPLEEYLDRFRGPGHAVR